jgi:hypothetical protein
MFERLLRSKGLGAWLVSFVEAHGTPAETPTVLGTGGKARALRRAH